MLSGGVEVMAQVEPAMDVHVAPHPALSTSPGLASAMSSQPAPIGDCNDNDPNVYPGAPEVVGNLKDDNCNGLADEAVDGTPSSDSMDNDTDGISLAQGDCDDSNPSVHPGAPEIVGDLIDNNCNGIADEDALGNPSTDTVDHDGDGLPMSNDRVFFAGFES